MDDELTNLWFDAFRLFVTVVYLLGLIVLPMTAGWILIYKLWIHKWDFVTDILFGETTKEPKEQHPKSS